jgi:hypothetical protein
MDARNANVLITVPSVSALVISPDCDDARRGRTASSAKDSSLARTAPSRRETSSTHSDPLGSSRCRSNRQACACLHVTEGSVAGVMTRSDEVTATTCPGRRARAQPDGGSVQRPRPRRFTTLQERSRRGRVETDSGASGLTGGHGVALAQVAGEHAARPTVLNGHVLLARDGGRRWVRGV